MKVIKTECLLKDLSEDQIKECTRLSYGAGGMTASWIKDADKNRLARIILLHRESDNLFLGWGIALTNKRKIGIFVGPHWRRRGLGTMIIDGLGKNLVCYPHDKRSAGLFAKAGLMKLERAKHFGADVDKYLVKT